MNDDIALIENLIIDLRGECSRCMILLKEQKESEKIIAQLACLYTYLEVLPSMLEKAISQEISPNDQAHLAQVTSTLLKKVEQLRELLHSDGVSTSLM